MPEAQLKETTKHCILHLQKGKEVTKYNATHYFVLQTGLTLLSKSTSFHSFLNALQQSVEKHIVFLLSCSYVIRAYSLFSSSVTFTEITVIQVMRTTL